MVKSGLDLDHLQHEHDHAHEQRHSCWSHSRSVSTDRKRYITGFLKLNSGHVCNIVGACLHLGKLWHVPVFKSFPYSLDNARRERLQG
jgi:hypothetical protein